MGRMPLKSRPEPAEAIVLTKAAIRAAERLSMTSRNLAGVLGLSESTVSRMKAGTYVLPTDQKAFELAALFVRFYRSLDAIVSGDDVVAAAWLRSENRALQGRPLAMIETVPGLMNVIYYLDARRALV